MARRHHPQVLRILDAEGFDATAGCQLQAVAAGTESTTPTPVAQSILDNSIFIPCYAEMPEREIQRLSAILNRLPRVAWEIELRRMVGGLPEGSLKSDSLLR